MAIVHRVEAAAVAARKLVARRVAASQQHKSTCSQQHATVGAGSNVEAHRSSWFGRRPWMELQPQAGRFVRVDDSHAVDKPRSAGMRGARADELAERPDRPPLVTRNEGALHPLQELFGARTIDEAVSSVTAHTAVGTTNKITPHPLGMHPTSIHPTLMPMTRAHDHV